jgi:hypothetical protein
MPPSPLLAGNGRTVSRETTFHVKPRQALARPHLWPARTVSRETTFHVKPRQALARPHLWPEIELCDPVKRGARFCPNFTEERVKRFARILESNES